MKISNEADLGTCAASLTALITSSFETPFADTNSDSIESPPKRLLSVNISGSLRIVTDSVDCAAGGGVGVSPPAGVDPGIGGGIDAGSDDGADTLVSAGNLGIWVFQNKKIRLCKLLSQWCNDTGIEKLTKFNSLYFCITFF